MLHEPEHCEAQFEQPCEVCALQASAQVVVQPEQEDVELLLQAEPQPFPQVEHEEDVELLLQDDPQPLPQVEHEEDVELLAQFAVQLPPQLNARSNSSSSLSQAANNVGPNAIPANMGSDLLMAFLKKALLDMNSSFILSSI